MSKWLASVQSVEEVKSLVTVLPDILDMKDPAKGALGALPVSVVSEIVALIDGRCLTSATVGDLQMDATIVGPAIKEMANSGVDYVKIGLFPDDSISQCITELENVIKGLKTPVIAVIFADKPLSVEIYDLLAQSGFKGVMIDTAIKNGQHLLDHMDETQLSHFISAAKQYGLLCGLAGALRYEDIATLTSLKPDYLGFRSALCRQRQRTAVLDPQKALEIQTAVTAA